ncbi:DUF502 domain-containing protein [Halalkalicoccus sp. NIPERK01]|uniref:DUF502 domain-containing protein n=1 Tax=Halalkalicoccus sp. NIPERK01 TaxID=3053469 RepID=UPI00256EB12A|nr:DUF502 domain-containing protein [Halalkalicoccus sp. NIPERK01]MDL5363070.1 DUF502 domain-containing protein [Halalkalicoccus sp. NIPERK01]
MAEWKRDLGSGLVVLVPLLVTLYAIAWLFSFIAGLPLVGVIEEPLVRVVVTLAVFAGALALVGTATRTAGGALASGWLDTAINRVPILRVVYNASQLAVETAVSGDAELKEPVKVTTWMGARMTAFKTGKRTDDGRMLLFMPTAPNVTTGYVIEVDPLDVEPTDETVEEAMTRLLSAGFGDRNRAPAEVAADD